MKSAKPKLVFFQYDYQGPLAKFLLTHKEEQVKCMSESFDVTVVNYDCDYQEICDQYQPELTIFESGVPFSSCRKPKVRNTASNPQIPKLGFLHSDGFCEARAGFLSDMDHLGIDTYFAIATTAAEHMPTIKNNLFTWPVFVNAEIYRDYGQPKSIPVLFTGNQSALYPWRHRILRLVSKHYPSLICPHSGYTPGAGSARVIMGESYARMINSSWCVPTCGTMAKEVVRKHFEVPACNSCLVTERSRALEAAGFVDMRNCVFVDEHDVVDKLEYLFRNSDELLAIIKAGYDLVHSKHELKHRNEIFQWFTLRKAVRANERIVQSGPFQPLRIVHSAAAVEHCRLNSGGLHLRLLQQANDRLINGKYGDAESLYLRCMNYYPYMPEPLLGLALCNLYKGKANTALTWIMKPLQFTLVEYRAMDPDPVEWAYFVLCLICLGKLNEAIKRSMEFPWLRHPDLDRVRWLAGQLKSGGAAKFAGEYDYPATARPSVHQLPSLTFLDWTYRVRAILKACGQFNYAEIVSRCLSPNPSYTCFTLHTEPRKAGRLNARSDGSAFQFARSDIMGTLHRKRLYMAAKNTLKRAARFVLHSIERQYRYFLPHRVSESKRDEFFSAIHNLLSEEGIKSVVIIGASPRNRTTQALIAGAQENINRPLLFCMSTSSCELEAAKDCSGSEVTWHKTGVLCSADNSTSAGQLDAVLKRIKQDNRIRAFDVLVIDASELRKDTLTMQAIDGELKGATFIILNDLTNAFNHYNYRKLLFHSDYTVLQQNVELRNGYAIFEKSMVASDVSSLVSTDDLTSTRRVEPEGYNSYEEGATSFFGATSNIQAGAHRPSRSLGLTE